MIVRAFYTFFHILKMMVKRLFLFQVILNTIIIGCSKNNDYTDVILKFEERYFHNENFTDDLPYRLYVPDGYCSAIKYPLVLILHGGSGRGSDNRSHIGTGAAVFTQTDLQSRHCCFVMAPQCPKSSQWVNTTFSKIPFDNYSQKDIGESDAMKMVIATIRSLIREFNIDGKRLYVIGSSMGASGTWDMITRYPDLFAGAVTISGVSDPSTAVKIAHIPIWAFHGRKDAVSPVHVTRNMINALRKYQSTCRFTEYEDRGHDIDELTFHNEQLIDWLFNQIKK